MTWRDDPKVQDWARAIGGGQAMHDAVAARDRELRTKIEQRADELRANESISWKSAFALLLAEVDLVLGDPLPHQEAQ